MRPWLAKLLIAVHWGAGHAATTVGSRGVTQNQITGAAREPGQRGGSRMTLGAPGTQLRTWTTTMGITITGL